MIMKNLSVTSPASNDWTVNIPLHLEPDDHMIMKNLSVTSPASNDWTINISLHFKTR